MPPSQRARVHGVVSASEAKMGPWWEPPFTACTELGEGSRAPSRPRRPMDESLRSPTVSPERGGTLLGRGPAQTSRPSSEALPDVSPTASRAGVTQVHASP